MSAVSLLLLKGFLLVSLFDICTCQNQVACPPGWSVSPNQQKCVVVQQTKVNWFNAELSCLTFPGGHLVSISNAFEKNFLNSFIQSQGNLCPGYWIGATAFQNGGQFQWSDGQPFSYRNWAPGEPITGAGGGDCAVGALAHSPDYWNSVPCDFVNCYVCESTPMPINCPDPSWRFNQATNACYKAYTQSNSWMDAESFCKTQQSLGFTGHLTSIVDANENAFVQTLVSTLGFSTPPICNGSNGWFWIGFNGSVSIGAAVYTWTDQTPFSYNNLFQSANLPDGQYCGEFIVGSCNSPTGPINNAQWNGYNCQTWLPFVCKIPIPQYYTGPTFPPPPVTTPGGPTTSLGQTTPPSPGQSTVYTTTMQTTTVP